MFKEKFKYYKSKHSPPDLSTVLDFYNIQNIDQIKASSPNYNQKLENFNNFQFRKLELYDCEDSISELGLKPCNKWEIFEVVSHQGLIFIKNPFTDKGQRYWTIRCLKDYSQKPNKSNLDPFKLIPQDKDWWDYCHQTKNDSLLKKLRWVTLGYHHNWDSKLYNEDNCTEFPKDLGELSKHILKTIGFPNYKAEAAIVNYYHMDSTLSGHTDHSEEDLEAPLLSFSLGQTAIFLVGGKTKEEDPCAMFLRSGDILIMSKHSRLCYHGVPKILQSDCKPWEEDSNEEQMDFRAYKEYLNRSRINVNIRQVLKLGTERLEIL